jgi:gag-polypeptide of LTR copia-type
VTQSKVGNQNNYKPHLQTNSKKSKNYFNCL